MRHGMSYEHERTNTEDKAIGDNGDGEYVLNLSRHNLQWEPI